MTAELRADCSQCFGLCCVVPSFSASADFAIDKAAGTPCPNLLADSRCGIHAELAQRGFRGCTVYDCFGAGQQVSQVTFGGQDWRQHPATAQQLFETFGIVRQLHELLWYLADALAHKAAQPIHHELRHAQEQTGRLRGLGAEALQELDIAGHWQAVDGLLLRTSELVRADAPGPRLNRRGADLIGADLRGAELAGTQLAGSIFLTQFQVNAANGDHATRLPATLDRPEHWRVG